MGRVTGWPGKRGDSPGAALGPAPGGSALTLTVPCPASPTGLGWARHDVTIAPDWSVEVPHDLAAERVAVALGGYSGCLELVERVVPAARARLQALARRQPPALVRTPTGGWVPTNPAEGCCRAAARAAPRDPVALAEHLRGNAHHAAAGGCRADLLKVVVRALVRAHTGGPRFTICEADLAAARSVVLGPLGVVRLWDLGLHPRAAVAVHEAVVPGGRALPVGFYLAVLTRGEDLAWLGRTLAEAGPGEEDADLAEWLAGTGTALDRVEPAARAEYLRLGVPRRLVVELSAAGIAPAGLRVVAEATRTGAGFAAALLGQWLAAGCEADPEAVARVYRTGVPVSYRPSAALLVRVRREAGRAARGVPAVTLAGLVGVAGSAPGAVAALRRGCTDPTRLAAELAAGEAARRGTRAWTQMAVTTAREVAGVGA